MNSNEISRGKGSNKDWYDYSKKIAPDKTKTFVSKRRFWQPWFLKNDIGRYSCSIMQRCLETVLMRFKWYSLRLTAYGLSDSIRKHFEVLSDCVVCIRSNLDYLFSKQKILRVRPLIIAFTRSESAVDTLII